MFGLRGNLDFPDFLQKKFYNINYSPYQLTPGDLVRHEEGLSSPFRERVVPQYGGPGVGLLISVDDHDDGERGSAHLQVQDQGREAGLPELV